MVNMSVQSLTALTISTQFYIHHGDPRTCMLHFLSGSALLFPLALSMGVRRRHASALKLHFSRLSTTPHVAGSEHSTIDWNYRFHDSHMLFILNSPPESRHDSSTPEVGTETGVSPSKWWNGLVLRT